MLNTDALVGQPIETKSKMQQYSLSFEEIHWLEESGKCSDYGKEAEFKTYADCVANDHEKIFKPILGCNVPWLVAPGNPDICKNRVNLSPEETSSYNKSLSDLILKIKLLDMLSHSNACLKPCVELHVYSTLKSQSHSEALYTGIIMTFNGMVKVTKYQENRLINI